jgi:septation ring formation regulator EzrA
MNLVAKLDMMEKIGRELEDLRNSQEAVLKKIGQIEIHNMEINDQELEEKLTTFYTEVADELDALNELQEAFTARTEKFQRDNNVVREGEEVE